MSDELNLDIEEAGAPDLAADDEPEVLEGQYSGPVAAVPAVPGWSGIEAELFLATIWNVGAFIYGPEWLARPGEMAPFRDDAAAVLDLVLPKSIGGPVGMGIHAVKIAGGLAAMGVARKELIKAGPKKPTDKSMAALKNAAQEQGPVAAAGGDDGKVSFGEKEAAVLGDAPTVEEMSAMGYAG